jgi:DNA-binding XRE family transcriptional regulator
MNIKNKFDDDSIDATEMVNEFTKTVTFGQLVNSMRECDNISVANLAKKVGVTRQFLHAVETGKRDGNLDLAMKIAEALGYPECFFLEACVNDMLRKKKINKLIKFDFLPMSTKETSNFNNIQI